VSFRVSRGAVAPYWLRCPRRAVRRLPGVPASSAQRRLESRAAPPIDFRAPSGHLLKSPRHAVRLFSPARTGFHPRLPTVSSRVALRRSEKRCVAALMSVCLLFSACNREARSLTSPKAREPQRPKHGASDRSAREIPNARRHWRAEHARFRQSPLIAFLRFQRAGHVFPLSATRAKARARLAGRCANFTTSPGLSHPDNTSELSTFKALIRSEMRTRLRVPSSLAVSRCALTACAASKAYPLREAGANRRVVSLPALLVFSPLRPSLSLP